MTLVRREGPVIEFDFRDDVTFVGLPNAETS